MVLLFHIYDQKADIFLNRSTELFLIKVIFKKKILTSMIYLRRIGKIHNTACITYYEGYCKGRFYELYHWRDTGYWSTLLQTVGR